VSFTADPKLQNEAAGDDRGPSSRVNRTIKARRRSAARKERRKRAKKIMSALGRAVGDALVPVRPLTDLSLCRHSHACPRIFGTPGSVNAGRLMQTSGSGIRHSCTLQGFLCFHYERFGMQLSRTCMVYVSFLAGGYVFGFPVKVTCSVVRIVLVLAQLRMVTAIFRRYSSTYRHE